MRHCLTSPETFCLDHGSQGLCAVIERFVDVVGPRGVKESAMSEELVVALFVAFGHQDWTF